MSLNKTFVFFVISFLIGIFIGNIFFDIFKSIIIYLLIILLFINYFIHIKKNHIYLLVLLIGFSFGLFYSLLNINSINNKYDELNNYFGQEVYIQGKVIDDYRMTNNFNSYILKLSNINGDLIDNKIYFLLRVSPGFNINMGDQIGFDYNINKVDNFDEGFNYRRFLLIRNIYFVVINPNVNILSNNDISFINEYILKVRDKVKDIVQKSFPKRERTLLLGILIGERDNISGELMQSYNNSGLTHFISISGFHISIIIIFLGLLFSFLPPFFRGLLILGIVTFFIMIVGFKVPAIRAGIMGIIGYYIIVSGREKDSLTLLLLAGFILILYNPLFLNYDTSFHLSFLAVIGIVYTKNFWEKIFFFLPSFLAIKQSFILTMSAMTTTLPIVIVSFGQFNLSTPIANMFVGGIMPFTMLLGFLSIMSSLFFESISYHIGMITYLFLFFINEVALYFGNLDITLLKFDFGFYGIYFQIFYLIIFSFILTYINTKKYKNN